MPERSSELSIRLEGSDDGLVRAPDFIDFLRGALSTLKALERGRSGSSRFIYTVTRLAVGSAAVTLRADARKDSTVWPDEIIRDFTKGLGALQEGTLGLQGFDPDAQKAFEAMLTPLRRHLTLARIDALGEAVELRGEREDGLSFPSQGGSASVGEYSGYIEAVNVHAEPVFYLYPVVGPSRVRCVFDQSLLEPVRNALKRYSTVYGLIEYAESNPFPSRIVVDRVEVNPAEEELPTLASLWGIAPDLTEGMDSAGYIRRLRDAEE